MRTITGIPKEDLGVVVGFSVFIIIISFFGLGGSSRIGLLGLTFSQGWTLGSLLGTLFYGIIYYASLGRKLWAWTGTVVFVISLFLYTIAVVVLTIASNYNSFDHLVEGIVLAFGFLLFDRLAQPHAGSKKLHLKNSFRFIDVPLVVTLCATFVYYLVASASSVAGSDTFLAGAFAFQLVSLNTGFLVVQLT